MKGKGIAFLMAALLLVSSAGCAKPGEDPASAGSDASYTASDVSSAGSEAAITGETTPSDTGVSGEANPSNGTGNTSKTPGGKTTLGGTTARTNGNGTTAPSSGPSKLVGNTYTSGFPIVKEKETISIMAITRPDVGDVAKSQFTKIYGEMTNMEIKWTLVSEDKAIERKRLAIESGAMPDIFSIGTHYVTQSDMLDYSDSGAFVEITKDMLNTYGPNIVAAYNDYPETWKLVTDPDDGKMYQIANFMEDYPYGQHYFWVNQSWLKALGLEIPKTMDEFYEMLVSFKYDDPNGNGQQDEIPFATWSSGGFVTNPWGIASNMNDFVIDKNGKVSHMYTTDNLKKCLTFWNRVYKEGLVDKNTINNWTGENAAFKTLIGSGKVGCLFYGYPELCMSASLVAQYVPMPWPTAGNNGNFPGVAVNEVPVPNARGHIITKSCKNVPAAIRFLDYLYTNDGYMLGTCGSTYKKVNETTYELVKTNTNEVLGPSWTLFGRLFLKDASIKNLESNAGEAGRKTALKNFENQISSNGRTKYFSGAQQTKKEIQTFKKYSTFFNTVSQKYFSFITGESNLSTDWTALQNEMASKGLKEYTAAMQAYYDRTK